MKLLQVAAAILVTATPTLVLAVTGNPVQIPEPSALALISIGIVGLIAIKRKKKD